MKIKAARIICIKQAQRCFHENYQLLLRNPLGTDRSWSIVTRGKTSSFATKNPPKLILKHEHRVNFHSGVSSLFVIVRQRFWIIGARNLIRRITHDCLSCFRGRNHTVQQQMADLPSVRITEDLPFVNTGCDYAGPIFLKDAKVRKPRISKGYMCLFFATDLTTETFLASVSRSTATTEQTLLELSDPSTKCKNCFHHNDIRTSSHPLWRMMEFTFEQMRTLLAQISAVINSRPLCYTCDNEIFSLAFQFLRRLRPHN